MTAKRARRVRWVKAVTGKKCWLTVKPFRMWVVKPQKPGRLLVSRGAFDHWHPDLRHWDWNRMDGKRGFW